MADSRINFKFPKTPYSYIPKSALTYNPSERICYLSQPKIKKDNLIRSGKINFTNYYFK